MSEKYYGSCGFRPLRVFMAVLTAKCILACFVVALFVFTASTHAQETCPYTLEEHLPTDERDLLIFLYCATGGGNWTTSTDWLTNQPHTDWYGVADSSGQVTGLDLSLNQLTGSIPAELGNLTQLVELLLWNNELTGSIPSELGNLTNLRFLYLYQNQLTGSIPSELGNLTNLQHLYLSLNQLTGSIPSELGNLTNLGSYISIKISNRVNTL